MRRGDRRAPDGALPDVRVPPGTRIDRRICHRVPRRRGCGGSSRTRGRGRREGSDAADARADRDGDRGARARRHAQRISDPGSAMAGAPPRPARRHPGRPTGRPMSAFLLVISGWDVAPWERRFRAAAPGRDIRTWPDRVGDPADIGYAAAWLPPPGAFAPFKNLRAIFSLGAAVHAPLADGPLPRAPALPPPHP